MAPTPEWAPVRRCGRGSSRFCVRVGSSSLRRIAALSPTGLPYVAWAGFKEGECWGLRPGAPCSGCLAQGRPFSVRSRVGQPQPHWRGCRGCGGGAGCADGHIREAGSSVFTGLLSFLPSAAWTPESPSQFTQASWCSGAKRKAN